MAEGTITNDNITYRPIGSAKLLENQQQETVVAGLKAQLVAHQVEANRENSATMTEDERRLANRIVENACAWAKDVLGIDIRDRLPPNARSADVRHIQISNYFFAGTGAVEHATISYNPTHNGERQFVTLFTHELFHRISRVTKVYIENKPEGMVSSDVVNGVVTKRPFHEAQENEVHIYLDSIRGYMLNEALTDMATISQLTYWQTHEKQEQEDYLESFNTSYMYDVVFWDVILEDVAKKSNIPYEVLQKEIFVHLLDGSTTVQRRIIDAYRDVVTPDTPYVTHDPDDKPHNNPIARDLLKRIPFRDEVRVPIHIAVLMANGYDQDDFFEDDEINSTIFASDVLMSYFQRLDTDLLLLEQIGLKDAFLKKLQEMIDGKPIRLLGASEVTANREVVNKALALSQGTLYVDSRMVTRSTPLEQWAVDSDED